MCKIEAKEFLREEVETYFWEKNLSFFVIIISKFSLILFVIIFS
jgi:hypothetical protein